MNKIVTEDYKPMDWTNVIAIDPGEPAEVRAVYLNPILNGDDVEHYPIGEGLECISYKSPNDMPMNRAFFSEDGKRITHIIWGPMYIVGKDEDGNFCDIDEKLEKEYIDLFKWPHFFVGSDEGLKVYSKRDQTTYVEEAFIHKNKPGNKRKKG